MFPGPLHFEEKGNMVRNSERVVVSRRHKQIRVWGLLSSSGHSEEAAQRAGD